MKVPRNFDLNSLRVLDALFHERSVTKAGQRLNMTQSAVSHALNRMRVTFEDQLFIRGAAGMYPTPRAAELIQALGPALGLIDATLFNEDFDPATADAELVVAASDYIIATIVPPVLRVIEETAPGVRVWFRPMNDVNLVEELDRGTLHLSLGGFGKVPARLLKTELTRDPNVWVMRSGHPAAGVPMTLDTLARFPHLDIMISTRAPVTGDGVVDQDGLERAYISSNPQYLDSVLGAQGLARRVGATVSHVFSVPPLLSTTDMIAYVPARFARLVEHTSGLISHEPPYSVPPLTISILSHRTMGQHPLIAWVAGLLKTSVCDGDFVATVSGK